MSTFFYVISFCSTLGTISLDPFAYGALWLGVLTQPHRDGWQLIFSAPYVRVLKKGIRRFAMASGGYAIASQDACCLNACTEGCLVYVGYFPVWQGFSPPMKTQKGKPQGASK